MGMWQFVPYEGSLSITMRIVSSLVSPPGGWHCFREMGKICCDDKWWLHEVAMICHGVEGWLCKLSWYAAASRGDSGDGHSIPWRRRGDSWEIWLREIWPHYACICLVSSPFNFYVLFTRLAHIRLGYWSQSIWSQINACVTYSIFTYVHVYVTVTCHTFMHYASIRSLGALLSHGFVA